MKVSEIMTAMPFAVTSRDSVTYAAEIMRHERIGSVPVVRDLGTLRLIGILTDRDIAVRCVARGHKDGCSVSTHMTAAPLQTVHADDEVAEVVKKMELATVRRIPVVAENDRLIGIVAQADLARKLGPTDPLAVEEVLERVSEPTAGVA